MTNHDERQILCARRLLRAPRSRPEDNIRQDISRLLDSFEIENLITFRTPDGLADLYLPRRRIFIETKAVGLADDPHRPQARENNETPHQQLERYLLSELHYEHDQLPLEEHSDRHWTGILTDGHVWHAWMYDHARGAISQQILNGFRPRTPDELLRRLLPILSIDPIGKPWVPSNPLPIFEPAHNQLQTIYPALRGRNLKETQTKNTLWLEMLRTASMEPENEAARIRLFVTHSFLVALARGVIHTLAHPNRKPDHQAVLRDGFVSWILATTPGRDWAESLMDDIHRYEWRRRRGDVLRPLYEHFVGERDRKAFGEYYTPDWLAALLVEHVLDDDWCENAIAAALMAKRNQTQLEGIGVLDPACGSGTFLYHAAQRLLRSQALADLPSPRRADIVARLVNGIDVHPVAAEISRATLLRALPGEPSDGQAAIRIFEGDSLLVNADDEDSLFRPENGEIRVTTPRGRELLLPRSFIEQPDFSANLRRMVAAAASSGPLPPDIHNSVPIEDRSALQTCHDKFIDIIAHEGNSVWTWYIANTTGPLRLTERKVDRIVANPPWVSMAEIQAPSRKRVLEHFADQTLGLWTGGRNAPHFDIAQLFVKRCRDLYLAAPKRNPAAWIVKRSALSSGGWERFRDWHNPILAQSLDLQAVQPFGGGDARRCCVLFEQRHSSILAGNPVKAINARPINRRPTSDTPLDEALNLLTFHATPDYAPKIPSAFLDSRDNPLFRQGATITPKVLTVLQSVAATKNPDETSVTTARSNKEPWHEVRAQTGVVPNHWIRDLLSSKELLPFACSPSLPKAIIPTDHRGRLDEYPQHDSAFWNSLDDIYREHRGQGRSTPRTLIARIDYNRGLSSQPIHPSSRMNVVLHPTSGDIMRAARGRSGTAIIQHTIHYFVARTIDEAAFLVALLNAPSLTRAFLQSRTSGRHFTNNPWRTVPIPRFDKADRTHRKLAALCKRAERLVSDWMSQQSRPYGQVAASTRIRSMLHEKRIFSSIDQAARVILPDHADS